jgi:hypothetical protein
MVFLPYSRPTPGQIAAEDFRDGCLRCKVGKVWDLVREKGTPDVVTGAYKTG